MKIKLDENMPTRLKAALNKLGHDADTVRDENLNGQSDPNVWKASQKDGRFLITQDTYFSDIRHHAPGTHHGVLLLRLPESGRGEVYERVTRLFKDQDVTAWSACNVVADEKQVRVRHA